MERQADRESITEISISSQAVRMGLYESSNPIAMLEPIGDTLGSSPRDQAIRLLAVEDFDRMTAGARDIGLRLGVFPVS